MGSGRTRGTPSVAACALGIAVAGGLAAAPAHSEGFEDVGSDAGVTLNEYTYGLAWNDFDGDGHADLFVCRHFEPPVIYRNLGNGSFDAMTDPPLFGPGDHHGPVVADFDNDGDADVYLTGGAEGGAGSLTKHLYRNDGAFQFVDITDGSGLADSSGRGRSCSAMDVNGDGWIDVFVAKARRQGAPNSLYINDGTGHFYDVAASAGIADGFGSTGGVFGDYDRDGDPDLFVSGEEDSLSQSRLYRNNGDLTFTNVTNAMLPGLGRVAAAAWGDYDKDGDLDLAVGLGDEALFDGIEASSDSIMFFFNTREGENGVDGFDFRTNTPAVTFDLYTTGYYGPKSIYIGANGWHPGPNTPFAVTASQAAGQPQYSIGESVGIFIWTEGNVWKVRCCAPPAVGHNFGGILDVNANILTLSTSDLEPYSHGPRGTRLYRNDGTVFTDVSNQFDIDDDVNVRNVTWVDYDRDGDLDLHVLAKGDTQAQNEPDLLYRNRTTHFTNEAVWQHLQGPPNGLADACAWEDYDNDADLDVAMLSGSPPRVYTLLETDRLYRHDTQPLHVLRVDLQGTVSSRDGLGAWVTCVSSYAETQSHYVTANAWRGGQVMTDAFFALRFDDEVDLLRVEWPSGHVTEMTDVPAGVVTVIEQGGALDAASVVVDPPVQLHLVARPTPTHGRVHFEVSGARGERGVLEVFDTAGRRVFESRFDATPARLAWDGRDGDGLFVANGVYYALLRETERLATTRVVILR